MEQNIEILNQIAANAPKVDSLLATISNVLNEMPDGHSTVGAADRSCENEDRNFCEARSEGKEPKGKIALYSECASKSHLIRPDSRTTKPLDVEDNSSLIRHQVHAQDAPTGSREFVTAAPLGEDIPNDVQACREVSNCF